MLLKELLELPKKVIIPKGESVRLAALMPKKTAQLPSIKDIENDPTPFEFEEG